MVVLRKVFLLIFRDKMILPMMFVMPVVQLILFPFAADLDVRELKIVVVDNDHSSYSQQLVLKIASTDLFQIYAAPNSYKDALRYIGKNQADIILQIPQGFERGLTRENRSGNELSHYYYSKFQSANTIGMESRCENDCSGRVGILVLVQSIYEI